MGILCIHVLSASFALNGKFAGLKAVISVAMSLEGVRIAPLTVMPSSLILHGILLMRIFLFEVLW